MKIRNSKKKNAQIDIDNTKLISDEDTPFAVVEAYKTIRTNLLFVLSQKNTKRVVISSSMPGEGKSTTAINTAIALSQLNHKVLLIDADMRKPSVNKKLKIKNQLGLSSLLGGFCKVSEAVKGIQDNLDVLTAGAIPPNPSELLGSDNMTKLLDALDDYYEYIIIDTPPLNIVTDALVVAPKTDGLIMVLREGKVTHDEFKKALNSIEFADVNLLGAIINRSGGRGKKGYYGSSYAYK